jgi:hypothetical protein
MTVTSKGRERWASELCGCRAEQRPGSLTGFLTNTLKLGIREPFKKNARSADEVKELRTGMGCFQEGRAARPDIQLFLSEKSLSMVFTSRASIFGIVGRSTCHHSSRELIQTHSADWPDAESWIQFSRRQQRHRRPQPGRFQSASDPLCVQQSRRPYRRFRRDSCSNIKIVTKRKKC